MVEVPLRYSIPRYPRQVRLDTTTVCNAFCLSCHRFCADNTRSGKMPIDMVEHILKDISKWEHPLQEIVPINYGEFFLYPDWEKLLDLCVRYLPNTPIVIPTNGSQIDEKAVEILAGTKTLMVVNFSVNAFLRGTHRDFTGLPEDTIDRIVTAVRTLREKRNNVALWASMVYDPAYHSDKEKEMFVNFWQRIGAVPQVIPASNCARYSQKIKVTLPCRSIFSDLVIGYDSKLSSCCFDARFSLELGYYRSNVLDAWKHRKLERLRRLHNEGRRCEVELCRACSFA